MPTVTTMTAHFLCSLWSSLIADALSWYLIWTSDTKSHLETAKVTKYASDFFFLMYGSLYGRILGSHEQTDIKN